MLREEIIRLNNDIAQHAKRKELDQAMDLFRQAIDKDSANSHTYAAIVNANVRCGRMDGAEAIIDLMKKKGRKRDVILCTTMIKGYCLGGHMRKAMDMFLDMTEKKPIIAPNIRTINTLLRGCLLAGDVSTGESLASRAQKDFKLVLDVSSWEYLTSLLAQSLNLDKALPIIGRIKSNLQFKNGLVNMHLSIARAAAILGDWKNCRKSLVQCRNALQEVSSDARSGDTLQPESNTIKQSAKEKKVASGGKRAWSSSSGRVAAANDGGAGTRIGDAEELDGARYDHRVESLELYQRHVRAEQLAEIHIIEAFMKLHHESGGTDTHASFARIFPYYLKLLPFGGQPDDTSLTVPDTASSAIAISDTSGHSAVKPLKKDLVKPIMNCTEVNFGLGEFAKRLTGSTCDQLHGYSLTTDAPVAPMPTMTSSSAKKKHKKNKKKQGIGKTEEDGGKMQQASMLVPSLSTSAATNASADAGPDATLASFNVAIRRQILSYRPCIAKLFNSAGQVQFDRLFSADTAVNVDGATGNVDSHINTRPVKLEVCSGAGEWAVAQARCDTESDWVALELRHDRAYQIFTKAVFANVRNLGILCGDAMQILPNHIMSDSVSQLFVNHPEPPQQTGGGGESQSSHLLDQNFFIEANRIIQPEGMLTIVTDNLWYGKLLIRLLSEMPIADFVGGSDSSSGDAYCLQSMPLPSTPQTHGRKKQKKDSIAHDGASASTATATGSCGDDDENSSDWQLQDQEGEMLLFVGTPGPRAGHVVAASSYFDRLWKRGQQDLRYFIVLKKARRSTFSQPSINKSSFGGHGVNTSINSGKFASHSSKNTKIKFE